LPAFWRTIVDQAVFRRYSDFSRGVLDTGNIVFFVVSTAVFLFFTIKVLESRRWK
jgi:ABC-2 type transport system permease protein